MRALYYWCVIYSDQRLIKVDLHSCLYSWLYSASLCDNGLGVIYSSPLDKMAVIWQTKFLNESSWVKITEFRFKLYWNLFQLTISHHWSGNGLPSNKRQASTWTNVDPAHLRIYAALLISQFNTDRRCDQQKPCLSKYFSWWDQNIYAMFTHSLLVKIHMNTGHILRRLLISCCIWLLTPVDNVVEYTIQINKMVHGKPCCRARHPIDHPCLLQQQPMD